MTDVHTTEVEIVHGERMSNIEGGTGVGRRRAAMTSVESRHEGPTAEVGKVIVQCGITGGGLSGVDHVHETAEEETLSLLVEAGQETRGTRQDREKETKTGRITYPWKLLDILIMP